MIKNDNDRNGYILMLLCRGSLNQAGYHTSTAEKLSISGII